MTKNKQRQSLHGAVLIMVITVMVVLIIMLMATLTVVTTAGQRIYTKFEENQAYYTARSALDVFTQNMLDDNGYYAYDGSNVRTYSYTGEDSSGNPKIMTGSDAAEMKQGLALQGELYKIRSQGETTKKVALEMTESDASLGFNDSNAAAALGFVENMYETGANGNIFGTVGGVSCPENQFFTVSDDAINDDDDTAKQYDYIEYQVQLPTTSDGSDYYGLMVDTDKKDIDGDGDKTEQLATIKVEVLDRMYHTSPQYTRENAIKVIKNGTNDEKEALKTAIKNGDRSKDFFKLKITSTVTFMDTEGTAVLIYDSTERPTVNSSKAITSVNDVSEGSGLFALGGASSLAGNISVDEGSIVYDSFFLKGNLNIIDSGEGMHMFKDTVHTVLGNFNVSNTYPTFDEEGSVFYVNGTTTFTVAGDFGDVGKSTNLISNAIRLETNAKQMNFYGNMYCDTFYLEKADIAQAPNVSGDIFANYVDLTQYFDTVYPTDKVVKISDDTSSCNITSILSKLSVSKGFIINVDDGAGNVVRTKFSWDGTLNFTNETTGTVYMIDPDSQPLPAFSYSPTNNVEISYNNPLHYNFKDTMKEFTLPANLAGKSTKKVNIPTVQSLYGEIFKEDAFVNNTPDTGTNGDLDNVSMPVFDTSTVKVTFTKTDGSLSFDVPNAVVQGLENGSIYINSTWDSNLQTLVNSGDITEEQKNNILNNWDDKQTSSWPTVEFDYGVKTTIETQLNAAKAADTGYQDDLKEYYNNYILGAERAKESLLKFTSSSDEIVINDDMSTIGNPDDFKAGGKYAGSYKGYIASSGFLKSNGAGNMYGTPSQPIVIDARTSEIIIQLGEANIIDGTCEIFGYFVVVGDNNVKLYLPDGRDYVLGSNASGQGFYMSTYDIHVADILRLGKDPNATPVPHVYMYVGDHVESVSMPGPTGDRFFTGYIYAPFSAFTMGADKGETYTDIYYNGQSVPASSDNGFTIVGSIIAKSYDSSNKSGVAYINPNESTLSPGDAILAWTPKQYTRN